MRAAQYVDVDGVQIAWSSLGDGPPVLLLPHWATNVETIWEEPDLGRFARSFAQRARIVHFDNRGCGLSDDGGDASILDAAVNDACSVLAAAGVERVAIVAADLAGFLAIRLAANHPELVSALALLSTTACLRQVEGYDIGFPPGPLSRAIAEIAEHWTGDGQRPVELQEPSHRGDGRYVQAASRYRRSTLSPGRARGLAASLLDVDVRHECEGVGCPTVVVHRRDDAYIPPSHAEWLAAAIASAELHILPGDDHTPWAGGHDDVLDVITTFFTTAGVDVFVPTRRLVRFGWDAVTPAEHRVIEILAGGATIASAGRALNVSPRTVETQLQSVYRKLDIRSRAALATALAEHGRDSAAR